MESIEKLSLSLHEHLALVGGDVYVEGGWGEGEVEHCEGAEGALGAGEGAELVI